MSVCSYDSVICINLKKFIMYVTCCSDTPVPHACQKMLFKKKKKEKK